LFDGNDHGGASSAQGNTRFHALSRRLLIGQLAVDCRHQGRGIGSMLVSDAFRRCVAGAEIIGGRAIVVCAIEAEAKQYWQSWGMVAARDDPAVLMRSIADIRAALRPAG
jgi:hypothetical protein